MIGWLAVTFDEEAYRRSQGGSEIVVELPVLSPPAASDVAVAATIEPPTGARAAPPKPAAEAAEEPAVRPKPGAQPGPPAPLSTTASPPEPGLPAARPAPVEAPVPAAPVPLVAPGAESAPIPPAAAEPQVAASALAETGPAEKAPAETALPQPAAIGEAPAPATIPPEEPIALAPVPDPALVVESPKGPLPVIAPDGRQAWQVYGRPFSDRSGHPRIAIVVAGMGLSRSATDAAIQQLPSPVTLAFAPNAFDLEAWIDQARAAGHEVMLQLPMEPFDYPANDPGPNTLLTSLSVEDNIDRLEWLLSRFTGYFGVTNYMGSRFTSSPDHLRPILSALKQRGLMFLDSRSSRGSVAGKIAEEIGLPRALNNRFLDKVASRTAIDARLGELERIARATGYAVGIGFSYPVTIERIAAWAATLEGKDLVLTPVSAIADKQRG